MLSWSDDADVFTKRSSMAKTGSLPRPGNSFEMQRTGSSRKSVEVPAPPGGQTTTMSPTNSLPKANSLLRGPGQAAEGTIGSGGWWHHMDHSQMNEAPADEAKARAQGQAKAAAFAPQFGITGQRQSLWADTEEEEPAAAAAAASPPAGEQPNPSPRALGQSPGTVAAGDSPASPAGPAAAAREGAAALHDVSATGCWARMDNSVLNLPAGSGALAPGAGSGGERVGSGGGFTPQFNVSGGSRYGSIFAETEVQQQQQSGDTESLETQVADWGPFCGQQGSSAAGGGAAAATGEAWSAFASAPKA